MKYTVSITKENQTEGKYPTHETFYTQTIEVSDETTVFRTMTVTGEPQIIPINKTIGSNEFIKSIIKAVNEFN